ncbi:MULTISPECIES: SDR family oxidoreductase [unclassified Rhodococcus (in: high G+C Gram-positive bacteria)]|uniref:SDR family oxidoreductase n=1 Tax=unclassified Rhodococcus (in: high G+C Gram-positive bacteria) TaxID=192944 RepID=UPI0006F9CD90|nr:MULTISPECIES: SDR family oxidoreductase [unclassified Rhodococcus (in: high G+C Gram-positive bacteria)]KQU38394.1 short-chain dehydrogenase [Rhodococcus sp. Leaf225]KQU39757.1 short-chain dehydrogenase [Rhodococcus sp. Leaf258]
MNGICRDRVVVITGAGRGIGREYALEFARQGAKVVVNDLGAGGDGAGSGSVTPAAQVVAEIREMGGEAIVNGNDVADFDGAKNVIDDAVSTFGRLDVLVNNAGILRDRMIANMSIDEWDSVIRVHLRGTFGPTRWAAAHWRERSKAGEAVDARLINTASSSGLYSNVGQANYAAAKAGIASLTVVASQELARYGVTANAVYPTALSRLTEGVFKAAGWTGESEDGFDPFDPANIAPAVVWLGSTRSAGVTGRVFGLRGGRIVLANGWEAGPTVDAGRRWDPAELDDVMADLVHRAPENSGTDGIRPVRVDTA